jgi:hypothetical protein
LIDYPRKRFAEERWPMSPALRRVREIHQKVRSASHAGTVAASEVLGK